MESVEGENYLKLVMNETLRMEPPASLTSTICMTEDIDIEGVPVKEGQMMQVNVYQLHHNEDQWGSDHD